MERRVRFDVPDYDPSSPINQIPWKNNSEDAKEHVIRRVNLHEDRLEEERKRIASVCDELKRLKPLSTMKNPTRYRSKSTAVEFLKGMKMFIVPTEGDWTAVERRFDKMTADTRGMLIRSKFDECIGIKSKEFALELFDALTRRRRIRGYAIDKCELYELWDQINDQSIESRLMMILDIADKDEDGRLTQDEVREFISLIASANNMSTIENKADEYAAQIMEEFDPNEFGYITFEGFKMLLKELETQCVTSTEETEKATMLNRARNPLKRWYKVIEAISSSSLIPRLKKKTIYKVEIAKQDNEHHF